MCHDQALDTPPESAASARRKVYGNDVCRRRPQASSLSGVRRQPSHAGGASCSDAVTSDESSTSCADDSSDGQVFDVIREESIRRPSGRRAQQCEDAAAPVPVPSVAAAAAAELSSPVNSSGINIVVDNKATSTDAPAECSASHLSTTPTADAGGGDHEQQADDATTADCSQQSGSKTFLLSEIT